MIKRVHEYLQRCEEIYSERTIETYAHYLEGMAEYLGVRDPGDVTPDDLRAWLSAHKTWGASSRHLAIVATRGFFSWCVGEGNSPAARLRLPKRRPKPQRTLSADEVEVLMAACDTSTPKGVRDLAMITLMIDTGLRVTETCRLLCDDVDLAERRLVVQVKGGSWGRAVFGIYTAGMLAEWITYRGLFAEDDVGEVFVSIGGNSPGEAMTRDGVRANFYKLSAKAGIERVSPHALRRTFATLALKGGAPSRLVQVAGRWSDITMVERYSQAIQPEDFDPYSPVNRIMGIDSQALS